MKEAWPQFQSVPVKEAWPPCLLVSVNEVFPFPCSVQWRRKEERPLCFSEGVVSVPVSPREEAYPLCLLITIGYVYH